MFAYACVSIKLVTSVHVSKMWTLVLTTWSCVSETSGKLFIHTIEKCHKSDQQPRFSKQTTKDEKIHHCKLCMYMFKNSEAQTGSLLRY